MAAAANVAFFFLTITASLMSCYSAARESPFNQLQLINATAPPPAGGVGRVLDCLTSLYKIKSCSGAIIGYFATGAIDITPACCDAIADIAHQCWPAVLTELGFSRDETDILRGYCNAFSAAAYATTSGSGSDPSTIESVASPLEQPLSPEN